MKRWRTKGIVLRRVDFSEADRIITWLTPEGKRGVIAKGVRKPQSKLAGGIELFSESDLTLIEGKGELNTLISARLITHFEHIIKDYERVNFAYQAIKHINTNTQDETTEVVYDLLRDTFISLNDLDLDLTLIKLWFWLQLLDELGHQPNFSTDPSGQKLQNDQTYILNVADGILEPAEAGPIVVNQIKTWRLLQANPPQRVQKVKGSVEAAQETEKYIEQLFEFYNNS